jgi:hypothetical protein
MQSRFRTVAITAVAVALLSGVARADQTYSVRGNDRYRVGTALETTVITYRGSERLSVAPDDGGRRYVAEVTYTRSDEGGTATVHARFVQRMTRAGDLEDRSDEDPDFLTVLNQPFAVQLDKTTVNDLRHLHGMVPFEASSPFGGASLKGYLRSVPAGRVGGVEAIGVHFEADGPMDGTLPQRPGAVLAGTMHMDGTAYYADRNALLIALDATLTIDGTLRGGHAAVPVKITYRRTFAPPLP